METNDYMLTTVDNPYDPFEQFALWDLFDKENGYNTCNLLARTQKLSPDMTQKEENEEYDRAVDEIIKYDKVKNAYYLVELQRKISESINVVMDGRDIGTVVLPDAEVKIYLNADCHERAIRRHQELLEKGISKTLEEVEKRVKFYENI